MAAVDDAAAVPHAANRMLTRRMTAMVAATAGITAAYAATFSPAARGAADDTSNLVQMVFGEQVNNLFQLLCFVVLIVTLSILFPEPDDLDTPAARKYVIGPLLMVSDICDVGVTVAYSLSLWETRSSVAMTSHNAFVCLCVHFLLVAFFFAWGVIYPTITFFFLDNSWRRLRHGLVVDAIGWYVCIAVLWVHGETHFPPGDVPLVVAISGRPAIALIGAATFNLANRRRLAAWAAAAGLFHVSLGLGELRRDEIRSVMGYTGRGAPSACGNESTTASSTVEDYESEAFAPRSHYTTKVSGPPHEVIDATLAASPQDSALRQRPRARSPRSRKSA